MPIGTLYDPFVTRGLDALYHALYSGARFIVVATPSGVTLSPEGGAHQSVITPGIGVALPDIVYWEPVFAREVEWILLDALARLGDEREGRSAYLRLSTRPIDQGLAPAPDAGYRAQVLRGALPAGRCARRAGLGPGDERRASLRRRRRGAGGRWRRRARCATTGIFASVFAVTSPDLLYRGLRAPRPYLEELVSADEEGVPVVSALDGHSHALAFLGGALGVPQTGPRRGPLRPVRHARRSLPPLRHRRRRHGARGPRAPGRLTVAAALDRDRVSGVRGDGASSSGTIK